MTRALCQFILLLLLLMVGGSATSQNLIERIENNHKKYVPKGTGPHPIVIAIPGCSGVSLDGESTDEGRIGDEGDRLFRRHYPKMAKRLMEEGYLVYLIDYLTAEGILNTCNGEITPERVGAYISDAISLVKSKQEGDSSNVHLIGWSHGGAGVLNWLNKQDGMKAEVQSVITIYPDCKGGKPWKATVPVLMLLGEKDDIAAPEECFEIGANKNAAVKLKVISYQDARHGFDITEAPSKLMVGEGFTIGRNEEASTMAWKEIIEFLDGN